MSKNIKHTESSTQAILTQDNSIALKNAILDAAKNTFPVPLTIKISISPLFYVKLCQYFENNPNELENDTLYGHPFSICDKQKEDFKISNA